MGRSSRKKAAKRNNVTIASSKSFHAEVKELLISFHNDEEKEGGERITPDYLEKKLTNTYIPELIDSIKSSNLERTNKEQREAIIKDGIVNNLCFALNAAIRAKEICSIKGTEPFIDVIINKLKEYFIPIDNVDCIANLTISRTSIEGNSFEIIEDTIINHVIEQDSDNYALNLLLEDLKSREINVSEGTKKTWFDKACYFTNYKAIEALAKQDMLPEGREFSSTLLTKIFSRMLHAKDTLSFLDMLLDTMETTLNLGFRFQGKQDFGVTEQKFTPIACIMSFLREILAQQTDDKKHTVNEKFSEWVTMLAKNGMDISSPTIDVGDGTKTTPIELEINLGTLEGVRILIKNISDFSQVSDKLKQKIRESSYNIDEAHPFIKEIYGEFLQTIIRGEHERAKAFIELGCLPSAKLPTEYTTDNQLCALDAARIALTNAEKGENETKKNIAIATVVQLLQSENNILRSSANDLQELQYKLAMLQTSLDAFSEKNKTLLNDNREYTKTVKQMASRLEELEKSAKAANDRATKAETDLAKTNKKLEKTGQAKKDAEAAVENKRKSLAKSRDENAELKRTVDNQAKHIESLLKKIEEQGDNPKKIQALKDEHEKEIANMQSEIEDLKKELGSKIEESKTKQNNLTSKIEELNDLLQQYDSTLSQKEQEKKELEDEIEIRKKELEEFHGENEELKNKIAGLSSKVSDLETTLLAKNDEIKILQNALNKSLTTELTPRTKKRKGLQNLIDGYKEGKTASLDICTALIAINLQEIHTQYGGEERVGDQSDIEMQVLDLLATAINKYDVGMVTTIIASCKNIIDKPEKHISIITRMFIDAIFIGAQKDIFDKLCSLKSFDPELLVSHTSTRFLENTVTKAVYMNNLWALDSIKNKIGDDKLKEMIKDTSNGYAPIHLANSIEMINYLIKLDASVVHVKAGKFIDGETENTNCDEPLHNALRCANPYAAYALMKGGARFNDENGSQQTAFSLVKDLGSHYCRPILECMLALSIHEFVPNNDITSNIQKAISILPPPSNAT